MIINKKRLSKCRCKTKKGKLCKCQMRLEDKIDSKPNKPKILFYDIETSPLRAWVWRTGDDQRISHEQLDPKHSNYKIICIGYKWEGQPVHILHWDYNKQNSARIIKEFDEIANKADIVIGKNSDRFDVKHLNMQRLLARLPGLPNWMVNTDDIEKQYRKYFAFPSNSLDYLAKELFGKGKDDMKMQNWIDIVEKNNKASFYKMLKYCKGDVENSEKLWKFASAHFKPKFNAATDHGLLCANCGSNHIKKNGTRPTGKTLYQFFYCLDHCGYAGKAPINKNGEYGKIG